MWQLIVGLFVGFLFGILYAGLGKVAGEADEGMERMMSGSEGK